MLFFTMSVIKPFTQRVYNAPVVATSEAISLAGSWNNGRVDSNVVCTYLVRRWTQEIQGNPIEMSLYQYVVEHESIQGQYKFFVQFEMIGQVNVHPFLREASQYVQALLHESKAKSMCVLFQQEQPGEGS